MWVERSAHAAPEASVRVVPCPVCSCEDIDAALSSVDTIWKVPRTVSHCRRCGLYFLDDMPSSDEIREWYNSDEAYAYGRIAGVLKQCFREFRSRSQHRYVIERKGAPAGGRVLEVGACEGRLLRLFRPSELVGLEYSVAYGTYAKRKFGIELQPRDIFELDGAFDLIVMSHVLEHFPDIHRVMAKVKQLLRPGGLFFAEVPNSPDPNICEPTELKAYLATTHTYNFTTRSLNRLFEESGFSVRAIDRFTYRFPSGLGDARRRAIAKIFLGDEPMNRAYAFDVVRYILGSMMAMDDSFERVTPERGFQGAGDNIRILARLGLE